MLTTSINNDALFGQGLSNIEQTTLSVINVVRLVPTLIPLAAIFGDGEGHYSRYVAEFYSLPDGEAIIRLPFDDAYKYVEATQIPDTHPLWAVLKDPNRDKRIPITIMRSKEGPVGEPANPRDVAWLKSILEPQIKRQLEELRRAESIEP